MLQGQHLDQGTAQAEGQNWWNGGLVPTDKHLDFVRISGFQGLAEPVTIVTNMAIQEALSMGIVYQNLS